MGCRLICERPENIPNGTDYHESLYQHQAMTQRGGRYYQRRHT